MRKIKSASGKYTGSYISKGLWYIKRNNVTVAYYYPGKLSTFSTVGKFPADDVHEFAELIIAIHTIPENEVKS